MQWIYALALLSASILLLTFAAKFRNGPNAAAWAKSNILLQTVLFTTIAGIVFAISMLIQFVINFETQRFGPTALGLLAAIVVVTWVCWRGIKKMPSAAPQSTIGTADNMPPPANTDGPDLGGGRRGRRKAA